MKKDKRMLDAALFTKSRSQIGLGDIRPVDHFVLFAYLCSKYNTDMKKIMNKLENEMTDQAISKILEQFSDTIINSSVKEFLNLFLIKRKDKMIDIFNKSFEKMEVL